VSLPPEWAPARRIYTALPWRAREWPGGLDAAQAGAAALARTIAEGGTPVTMLVPDRAREERARGLTGEPGGLTFGRTRYGDIWLRDTGPIFGHGEAVSFRFNGWGGKFEMPGDERVARYLARVEDLPLRQHDFVLEGGAIDHDGADTAITTEECLLNPNRNPGMSRAEIERVVCAALGFERLVWLGAGLIGDHTDGHVDNLARFVAPGRVMLPEARDADDPNAAIYEDAARRVEAAGLALDRVPSVGRYEAADGTPAPASYMNFILTGALVIVPTYGAAADDEAVARIGAAFPDRRAVGLDARGVLAGGGAFHCMTCHVPA
jgi:agmatine deiminase